jgi:hypothetical protein
MMVDLPTHVKTQGYADKGQGQVPEYRPSPFNDFIYNQLIWLIKTVDIDVKVVVDDIATCCNANRGDNEAEEKGVPQGRQFIHPVHDRYYDAVLEKALGQNDEKKIHRAYQPQKTD